MRSGTELAGRYRLDKAIEHGGTGELWHGRDLRLNREVTVRLPPAAGSGPDETRQLLRDAESAAGLRHPGIIAVLDVDKQDGQVFIVTEPPPGRELAGLLTGQPGGLPVGQALCIGLEIAAALAHAHGRGIVHRDLTPQCVFVAGDGTARVGGFGLAREPSAASTAAGQGQPPGTPSYVSPELWAGEPATTGADLYALGCTLYELLTGRPPFQGPGLFTLVHRHLTEVPVPPHDRRPEVPTALSDLVLALLAKAPEDRPPDAAAVASALRRIRDHGQQAVPRTPAVPSGAILACTSPAAGAIDLHAVTPGGRIRRLAGAANEADLLWQGWDDLTPATTGQVTALGSGSSGRGVYVTAVIDGIPFINEGLTEWRELLEAYPLRLPAAGVTVPSASRGAADDAGVTAYVLDGHGIIWSSRATMPLNAPGSDQFTSGRFSAIASCSWGRTDPVLLAASGESVQCRYWWAGTHEFRWRRLPLDAAGPVTGIACASLAAKRIEAFTLCDDGSIRHSSLRLAQEGTLDWSVWLTFPPPPGHVTAIATCQFDHREAALIAATSDGEIHCAQYGIEVLKTGLARWSRWSRLPG
jgi:hypothetical protein